MVKKDLNHDMNELGEALKNLRQQITGFVSALFNKGRGEKVLYEVRIYS